MSKNTEAEISCGSFDQPDLYSSNDYKFFFSFCNCKFQRFGACNISLEGTFQELSNGVLHAPKFLKFQLLNSSKKISIRLGIADQGGQKNRNWFQMWFFEAMRHGFLQEVECHNLCLYLL